MLELAAINLNFGQKNVLKNLNYVFKTGITALTGENGSGKTSLLNMIAGQIPDYTGSLKFNDKKIDPYEIAYCRQFMADAFFTGSVTEEICYTVKYSYSNKSETEIWSQLEQLGMDKEQFSHKSPFELHTTNQKLLSFILSIIKDYKILLLDETDSGLPFGTKKKLADFIKSISPKIIIVVSHDLWFINQLPANILNLETAGNYSVFNHKTDYFQQLDTDQLKLKTLLNKTKIIERINR